MAGLLAAPPLSYVTMQETAALSSRHSRQEDEEIVTKKTKKK